MKLVRKSDLVAMQWHLVLCKPNQHHIAHRNLSRLNCDVFMPRHHVQRGWRGRIVEDVRPIFPGYIFVGIDPVRPIWQAVRSTLGVSRIVGFGTTGPATVPSEIVAGLMARCDDGEFLRPLIEEFAVGDRIKIISGPFADFITAVERIDPERRLHILIDLLGRQTRVALNPAMAIHCN